MTDENVRLNTDQGDGDIQRLLRLAGPRLQPPAELEARVRAATLAAFEMLPEPAIENGGVGSRVLHRWAIAASVLLTLGLVYLFAGYDADQPSAGEVLFATGAYTVRGPDGDASRLAPGSIVQTSTGGRLLIGMADGRTLRIDQGASLTLHSDTEIWLHGGRIYVDAQTAGEPVTVITRYASITDVGTQFEVAVEGDTLLVATREGQVDVLLGEQKIRSSAAPGEGEVLSIVGLGLESRQPITTVGERWDWIQAARPLFPVLGRSVRDYLEWAARESGRHLRFDTELAAQQAQLRRLSGQAEVDADPVSVGRVLATTSFHPLEGPAHELIVGFRSD